MYWHQGPDGRCWDNHAKGAEHYDPRPHLKMTPPPVPSNVAASPPSELERPAAHAPVAEFYYPVLVHDRSMLDDYHVLVWPQPWLNPDSIMHWPLLLDADRTPFTTWNKRVGQ